MVDIRVIIGLPPLESIPPEVLEGYRGASELRAATRTERKRQIQKMIDEARNDPRLSELARAQTIAELEERKRTVGGVFETVPE